MPKLPVMPTVHEVPFKFLLLLAVLGPALVQPCLARGLACGCVGHGPRSRLCASVLHHIWTHDSVSHVNALLSGQMSWIAELQVTVPAITTSGYIWMLDRAVWVTCALLNYVALQTTPKQHRHCTVDWKSSLSLSNTHTHTHTQAHPHTHTHNSHACRQSMQSTWHHFSQHASAVWMGHH